MKIFELSTDKTYQKTILERWISDIAVTKPRQLHIDGMSVAHLSTTKQES